MAELIRRSDYARRRGVTSSAVSNAIKAGRISLGPGGLIDPDLADQEWEANTDKRQALRAYGGIPKGSAGEEPAALPTGAAFLDWRTRKERAEALCREIEYQKAAGGLCPKADVERGARTAARLLRDQILSVPARVAAELAAMTDARAVEQRLRAELRAALAAIESHILTRREGE